MPIPWRFPMLLMGAIALITGMLAGIARMGGDLGLPGASLVMLHGPLMTTAFLGTVISLERAVALRHVWAYLAPVLTGLGGLLLVTGIGAQLPLLLITAGSVVLAGVATVMWRKQSELFTLIMMLGAYCWLGGNLLWLLQGWGNAVILAWAAFLVLTITGERLELSRFVNPPPSHRTTILLPLGLLLIGTLLAGIPIGAHLFGAGLVAFALWLLRYDAARITVKRPGVTRYIGICLLAGFFWLFAAGGMLLVQGLDMAGLRFDAALHALFVGFVFSMIFGHAPVIVPSVLHVRVPYHPVYYVNLLLLHGSLALRVAADHAGWIEGRIWGGTLNALEVVMFLITTVTMVVLGRCKAG
jgi:hypothetical protein